MSKILVVTWDGGGNVPPALGVAEELRRRGHTVRFLGHAQQRERIERAGFRFAAYQHARPWSSTQPLTGVAGARTTFRMFADRGPGLDLLAEVAREPADLVVIDCMSLGCLHAAERAGLRRVVLAHTYFGFLASLYARGPVGAYARLHGLHPLRLWAKAPRVLVASDRDLDPIPEEHLPPSVRHTGVVQPQPGSVRPATRSGAGRVLVSLSTTFFPGQDQALQRVLDALAELADVRGVVTTGEAVDPERLRAPGNVEVHRFLPHEQVMPDVDLVIGHGGHATSMRALAHDLPLLVLPMHPALDQKMIGRSVEQAGAGRVLSKSAKPGQLRAVVEELLANPGHQQAAARLGSRLRAQDGTANAAREVESLLP